MATAYIIKTADGQMQINYGDGSVQTGTEDQLRATLAKNLPNYDIEIFNSTKTAAENVAAHQAKYDSIGDFATRQESTYSPSSSSPSSGATSSSSSSGAASSGSSSANQSAIQKLADLTYLSMNTGVSSADLNAAYEALGIDSSSNFAYNEANKILEANGYNLGNSKNFYGNNQAQDIGAQLLYERWQDAPTEEELEAAGMSGMSVINSNTANSEWLTNALAEKGIDTSQTSASTGRTKAEALKNKYNGQTLEELLANNNYWGPKISQYGSYDNATLDMTEWEKLKALPKVTSSGGGGGGGSGGGFTPTQPSTEVLNLGPGEVAPIDPDRPQTVVQSVGPVTYGNENNIATSTQEGVDTGTFSIPLQTAGLSAVPNQVTYKTHYAGTSGAVPQTLVNTAPGVGTTYDGSKAGYQTVTYANVLGQRIPITEFNGIPTTYVPPGFMRLSDLETQQQASTSAYNGGLMRNGYAAGGSVPEDGPDVQLARKFLGFQGPSEQLTNFLAANPAAAARMGKYQQAMAGMARNRVGAQTGIVGTSLEDFQQMQQNLTSQTMQPIQSTVAGIQPTAGEFIPVDAGSTVPIAPFAEAATVGTVQQADMPTEAGASTYTAATSFGDVSGVTSGMQPAQGTVSDQAQVAAAQQGTSAVSDLKAEQGTAIMMDNPVQREIQDGELISGEANAEKAAAFTEQIQAATAEPSTKATVQGQLEGLMAQFEGGETPPWAAGSMRSAMAMLANRGLGASSLAGQAVIQAAMEAALPIAQIDAQTQAQFESQNLSNRQQRAMLAAQQRASFMQQEFDQAFQARVQNSARIGDIANMNFTAEQQIALENSRAANTMNLQNLSNTQALVMAEAAALSQLDMANLSNRQQAAVQNAQNFLQMDLTNLSNEQQTAMFKAQQNIQALFTDQAAENAAAQFNASSENQTNQFFANLKSQTSQFNATQQNAMDQFNVNSTNAMRQFNSELQQQRDMFNAQNGLVIAQANAQWRQNIATLNQAAQNESNMNFAKTINALTSTNLDNIWQRERDIMSYAFTAQQSALDRSLNLLLGDKKLEQVESQLAAQQDAASTELAFRFFFGSDPDGLFGGIFK